MPSTVPRPSPGAIPGGSRPSTSSASLPRSCREADYGAQGARHLLQVLPLYAVALGIVPSDPCRDLRGAVSPKPGVKHRAALTNPAEIGELMWGIANFPFSSLVIR